MSIEWLTTFLPKLRCPNTGEALRLASEDDKKRASLPIEQPALACESALYVYPVVEGIPHLLPSSGLRTAS